VNIPVGDISPCFDLVEPCPPEVVKFALELIAALVETVHGDKPEALHTHKHAEINDWLAKHPRTTRHFTPASGSWLNLVEVFFGIITRQAIRRGTFTSVPDLITAHQHFHQRMVRTLAPHLPGPNQPSTNFRRGTLDCC
jgi:DDE superfamily endonuclease